MLSVSSKIARIALRRGFASGGANFIQLKDIKAYDDLEDGKSKYILYYTATWCPPCRRIGPVYENLSKIHPDIQFTKIDIDELPEAAERNFIRSVPTFIFKHGNRVIHQFSGADETTLAAQIDRLKEA